MLSKHENGGTLVIGSYDMLMLCNMNMVSIYWCILHFSILLRSYISIYKNISMIGYDDHY